jgi:hypothetical protein
MKTFKEWVKKRIREDSQSNNPLNVQADISAVLNPSSNPASSNPNLLATQMAQKLPNTVLASLAKNPKMQKLAAMNALNPKNPNQVSTPGLNAASNFN